jgi:hypothetical protein
MYSAYLQERSKKDPSTNWYESELWFFDNHVIPLAHRLKDCGVFGISGDEYLKYALRNRKEWEVNGHDAVEAMKSGVVAKVQNADGVHMSVVEECGEGSEGIGQRAISESTELPNATIALKAGQGIVMTDLIDVDI